MREFRRVFEQAVRDNELDRMAPYIDPFGNPMVRSEFRSLLLKITSGCTAIGLMLGVAGGYWLRRR